MSMDYTAMVNFDDADFTFDDSHCPDIEAMAEAYHNTQEMIAASNADVSAAEAESSRASGCFGVPP